MKHDRADLVRPEVPAKLRPPQLRAGAQPWQITAEGLAEPAAAVCASDGTLLAGLLLPSLGEKPHVGENRLEHLQSV